MIFQSCFVRNSQSTNVFIEKEYNQNQSLKIKSYGTFWKITDVTISKVLLNNPQTIKGQSI